MGEFMRTRQPKIELTVTRRLRIVSPLLIAAAFALAAVCGYGADPRQGHVRVGFVHSQSPSTASGGMSAFWERLRQLGYVEGQNLSIDARWAEGRYERLPALINDVLGGKPDVLVTYGYAAAAAAKNATTTVPIVGVAIGDAVRSGLTASVARPEGNLTGLSVGWTEGITGKWLEMLQETVPRLVTVVVIGNPNNAFDEQLVKELEGLAPARKLSLRMIKVSEPGALASAFEQAERTAQAVLVLPDAMFSAHRKEITALAAKHRLPAMYYLRDYVDVGGLMAYALDFAVLWSRAADFVDKILKGAKPADLPIEQPTEYLLFVNLKTAQTLGLKIPESILLRAEVIR